MTERNQVLDQPHCVQCGNTHVEETVGACSWGCLHAFAVGEPTWDQKVQGLSVS